MAWDDAADKVTVCIASRRRGNSPTRHIATTTLCISAIARAGYQRWSGTHFEDDRRPQCGYPTLASLVRQRQAFTVRPAPDQMERPLSSGTRIEPSVPRDAY